jgi:hypothetical protein
MVPAVATAIADMMIMLILHVKQHLCRNGLQHACDKYYSMSYLILLEVYDSVCLYVPRHCNPAVWINANRAYSSTCKVTVILNTLYV